MLVKQSMFGDWLFFDIVSSHITLNAIKALTYFIYRYLSPMNTISPQPHFILSNSLRKELTTEMEENADLRWNTLKVKEKNS